MHVNSVKFSSEISFNSISSSLRYILKFASFKKRVAIVSLISSIDKLLSILVILNEIIVPFLLSVLEFSFSDIENPTSESSDISKFEHSPFFMVLTVYLSEKAKENVYLSHFFHKLYDKYFHQFLILLQ